MHPPVQKHIKYICKAKKLPDTDKHAEPKVHRRQKTETRNCNSKHPNTEPKIVSEAENTDTRNCNSTHPNTEPKTASVPNTEKGFASEAENTETELQHATNTEKGIRIRGRKYRNGTAKAHHIQKGNCVFFSFTFSYLFNVTYRTGPDAK